MGRLIDASNLNFEGQNYNKSQMKAILDFIDAQPTAYDVEKVIAELEESLLVVEIEDEHIIPESNVEEYFEANVVEMNEAIDIVKRGGIE